jgi:hypothetical protein
VIIAQVAPLLRGLPPQLYRRTERGVSHLTEELLPQGHQVTLFATGDSQTRAKLARLATGCQLQGSVALISYPFYRLARSAGAFDIIHFHTDYFQFPLFRRLVARR